MKGDLILLITICFLLSAAAAQSCQTYQDPKDLMQTGIISVMNGFGSGNPQANREHVYTIPIVFPVTVELFQGGGSFSDFQSGTKGFDFILHVSLNKNPSQADIILLITQDDSWTKLRISYFLHSRKEFYISFMLVTDYAKTWRNRPSEHNFVMPFPTNWVGHYMATSATRAFGTVNGLRTSLKINQIRATYQNFTTNGFYFNLYIDSLSQIEYLSYNFIFFDDPSYFYEYVFQPTTPTPYDFYGPEKINNNQFSFYPIGFKFDRVNCYGSSCPQTCITQYDCKNLKGNIGNSNCYLCGNEQVYRGGQCENSIYCGMNQIHNGYSCSCAKYYVNVSGMCEPACGLNAYVNKDGVCMCIAGQNLCNRVKACRKNEILVGNDCQCALGYLLFNGQCELNNKCSTDFVWNSAIATCEPCSKNSQCGATKCPPSSTWNGTACICNQEFYLSGGACVACPKTSMWVDGECICLLVTQYFSNGQCLTCPTKTRWNGKACA